MPAYSLEFHPEAVAEARAAVEWYQARSQSAANAFTAELDSAFDLIIQSPQRWSPYVLGTRRYLLRRFPFSIVYRVQENRIEVIAVAHGRRRPGYWVGR